MLRDVSLPQGRSALGRSQLLGNTQLPIRADNTSVQADIILSILYVSTLFDNYGLRYQLKLETKDLVI